MGILKGLISIFLLVLIGCTKPTSLDNSLEVSGSNRRELEKVLNYYLTSGNSLKYDAACYLIENIPYHFSKEECFFLVGGENYRPSLFIFEKNEELQSHCDSLRRIGASVVSKNIYDRHQVKSDFLIKNIELAFEVWQKPWAKDIPFEVFCRYILPYRAQIEPLTDLREELMKRYMPLLDSAKVSTPLEACIVINEQLRKEIRYGKNGLPFYPTIEDTYYSGISNCDGLCNLGVHIMRAVGIPVTVDYIPIWTKMDLGHSWCAVWDNGQFYSFGPGEQHPDEHLPYMQTTWSRKPAKVYRKHFNYQKGKENLLGDQYISYLKNPLIEDVTSEYWDEHDLSTVRIKTFIRQKNKKSLVYMCTHNSGEWQPLAIGERKGRECVIPNVRGDNVFIIADSPTGDGLRYITHPFYVDTEGRIEELIPDFNKSDTFSLENIHRNRKNMNLTYWNYEKSRFVNLRNYIEKDTITHYQDIPANALLRFSGRTTGVNQQRVFFLRNDSLAIF